MTRYLCVHPGHDRKGRHQAVDVTAQVRLEREFQPRSSGYLASTDDVISRVLALRSADPVDRVAGVRRVLTGTTAPIDAPVVLVADAGDRAPGLYEIDELRRGDTAIAGMLDRRTHESGAEDLVILHDAPPAPASPSAAPGAPAPVGTEGTGAAEALTTTTQLEQAQRARVIPQGVFPVMELSARIADADADERAIVDAIRSTTTTGTPLDERTGPWRVVVECPTAVGDPPAHHRAVFTGTGEHEPAEVLGTPAVGWDVELEDAARLDLAPPAPSRKAERRLWLVLATELALAVLVLVLAWASGGLAQAVRETPEWLAFAATLGIAAMAIGLVGLIGRSDPEGNANDTFVLRRHYSSRTQLFSMFSAISAGVFAVALAAGVVPPVLDAEPPVPAPVVTFLASNRVVTATVQVDGRDVATDDLVTMEVRQYSAAPAEGVLVGRVTASGDSAGRVRISESMALDRQAMYMTVLVTVGDRSVGRCTPLASAGAGCTVLAVPPLGAGVVRFVPADSVDELIASTEPTLTPAPTVSPAPTFTPTPSVPPSISPSLSPTLPATPSPTA